MEEDEGGWFWCGCRRREGITVVDLAVEAVSVCFFDGGHFWDYYCANSSANLKK